MGETAIEWTDYTFNPWWGCSKVSPGCTNCYAEKLDARFGGDHWGVGKPRRRTSPANWAQPRKWGRAAARSLGICVVCNAPVILVGMGVECGCGIYGSPPATRRPRVFCASMADWLDPEVPVEWLSDLLAQVAATPSLDWQMLTKRPELWRQRMDAVASACASKHPTPGAAAARRWLAGTPPANVWVGASVEDQRRADERIPALLSIPALLRFLSVEPLLGPVDLRDLRDDELGVSWDCLAREAGIGGGGISWAIIGGESGHGARTCDVSWIRSLVGQCRDGGVPAFVKQLGSRPVDSVIRWIDPNHLSLATLGDRKGGDPSEWPADLRVREFPVVR